MWLIKGSWKTNTWGSAELGIQTSFPEERSYPDVNCLMNIAQVITLPACVLQLASNQKTVPNVLPCVKDKEISE